MATIFDKIPGMNAASLQQLVDNARARPGNPQSEGVIEAATAALETLKLNAASSKAAGKAAIKNRYADEPLAKAFEAALKDRPPTDAQLRRLQLIHENPGRDEDKLADLAGDKDSAAFNLWISALCRDRADYLPPPKVAALRKQPQWSDLICEIVPKVDAVGRKTHGWTLRPEAEVAMRRLGLLKPKRA